MQEGGPDIFRKGCWRSSWAVALCDGSLTSIMSRKDRSTDDTCRTDGEPSGCGACQCDPPPPPPSTTTNKAATLTDVRQVKTCC